MTYKKVDTLCWLDIDDKVVLVIGKKWKGTPLIGVPLDMLIIQKKLKDKYHDRFLPCALKECKIVYVK
jgi:hypothetical protein